MRTAADIAGEGAEEAASTVITPYLQRAMYNPDAPNATPEEIAQSALIGSLAAGVLQGGLELPAYLGERADTRNRVTQAAEANLNNPEFVRQGEEQVIRDVNSRINDRTVAPRRDLLRENPLETMLPTWEEVQRRQAGSPVYQSADNRITLPGGEQQNTESTWKSVGYTPQEVSRIRHEGKTFRNLVAGIDTTISGFFDRWKAGRKNQSGEKLEKLYLGKMNNTVGQRVSFILGYDVAERDFIITNDDVKHIVDQHGDADKELRRGNRPLEPWVFESLPEVLSSPDSITPGHIGEGKKNSGKTGLVFSKAFPNGRVVSIQFDNKGRGTLEVTTLYVKEGTTTSEMDAAKTAPIRTSETPEPVLPSEFSILPGGQEVNRQDAALFAELPTASTYDTEDIYDIYGSGSENLPETAVGANKASPWDLFVASSTEFFPEGANAARDVDVPTTDPQGRRIRKTAATAMGAKAIPDEAIADIQNIVLRGELSYNRVSDKASIDRAVKTIQDKGYQGAPEEFRSAVSKGVVSKDIATLGQQLLVNAANAGDGRVMMILNFRSL